MNPFRCCNESCRVQLCLAGGTISQFQKKTKTCHSEPCSPFEQGEEHAFSWIPSKSRSLAPLGMTARWRFPAHASSVWMRLIVNIHQLPDRCVRILLRSRERLVPKQLLNRPQVRAIGQEVCRKRMPHRVWMQIPVYAHQLYILLHDSPDAP